MAAGEADALAGLVDQGGEALEEEVVVVDPVVQFNVEAVEGFALELEVAGVGE